MQALSNGLWSLAVLWQQPEPAVLAALVAHAQKLLPASTSPQAISNLLWAIAKLGHDPGPAFVTASVSRALVLADALGCVPLDASTLLLQRPSEHLRPAGRRTWRSSASAWCS